MRGFIARFERCRVVSESPRTLDLRQLRYFLMVAEELNFGRAAQRLMIAGPSLSQQIKALERDLKVQLFERNHHSVALTPTGITLLPHVRALVDQADDLRRRARGFACSRPIRIGLVNRCPPGWAELARGVAPVIFDTWVMPSPAQAARVAVGNLDLALCHLATAELDAAGLIGRLAGVERLHAICAGSDARPVNAKDIAVLVEADAFSWSSWNSYARKFAEKTGAQPVSIEDGGLTGGAFFDHVRRLRRPVLNAPKGPSAPLPQDMTLRPVVDPVPLWTWSLVRRTSDERPVVAAVLDAFTKGVASLDLMGGARWVPDDDPHYPQSLSS
ncbi:LysR family transcriptional regulator [Mycobacterium paraffinicum]|uniref:Probable hydrogen peroxide-inducible genes activator n=1 Tax=Mycobacterium paraffinicum TaxID=53378 RepID=A0A1Q4HYG5_9MYCO|nr:LysR family transcriptional regulator [Mycobacterium paraffinicum]OJZ74736.1 LysR family transcriptional regulator [Mycobacterium paraffinicum]